MHMYLTIERNAFNLLIIATVAVYNSQVLPSLTFCQESSWFTLAHLIQTRYRDIKSAEAQEALLHLLQMHSSCFDKAPDILEDMINVVEEEAEKGKTSPHKNHPDSVEGGHPKDCNFLPQMKLSLLSAMVHVSLDRPAKVQKMLSQFMEHCVHDENRVVRDRALFLYGYLLSEVKQKLLVAQG